MARRPDPLLDTRWVVAALDRKPYRYLCRASKGHWVVTMDFDKAQPFELAEAFDALEAYRTQTGAHYHAAGGEWKVYQATTRTTFAEPSAS
jgi:hypothetical protein